MSSCGTGWWVGRSVGRWVASERSTARAPKCKSAAAAAAASVVVVVAIAPLSPPFPLEEASLGALSVGEQRCLFSSRRDFAVRLLFDRHRLVFLREVFRSHHKSHGREQARSIINSSEIPSRFRCPRAVPQLRPFHQTLSNMPPNKTREPCILSNRLYRRPSSNLTVGTGGFDYGISVQLPAARSCFSLSLYQDFFFGSIHLAIHLAVWHLVAASSRPPYQESLGARPSD